MYYIMCVYLLINLHLCVCMDVYAALLLFLLSHNHNYHHLDIGTKHGRVYRHSIYV